MFRERLNVASKREELNKEVPHPAKKQKPSTSLIGKMIRHKYDPNDNDGNYKDSKWYEGKVIRALKSENNLDCLYEVKCAGDDTLCEVELQQDIDHIKGNWDLKSWMTNPYI